MTKKTNYTDVQVETMREQYESAESETERLETVKALAIDFGKPVASIRAKLSAMGVYIRKGKTTKSGKPVVKKDALVELISAFVGKPSELLVGLEKANKETLVILATVLNRQAAEIDDFYATADEPETESGE